MPPQSRFGGDYPTVEEIGALQVHYARGGSISEHQQWMLLRMAHLYAQGEVAAASESRTRLDGIEEAARLLDDTRLEMRAPWHLADYGRGVLKDAADSIRRLKEIK